MSDQIARFFAAAAERADAIPLAGAAAAGRTGTRRRRARIATLAVVCALVVAAIPVGVHALTTHRRFVPVVPPTSAPTTAPPSPTPSPTPTPSADPCSFQPAQCYPPVRQWQEERLPAPCTRPSHPSDVLIVRRSSESRSSYYDLAEQGTTMYAVTLTRYRNGGAAEGSPSLPSRFDQFVADAIAEVRAGKP